MCMPTDLNLIPPGLTGEYCECGELLDHEAERDVQKCFNCQVSEANHRWAETERERLGLITAAQIDELCGVTHSRRVS